METPTHTKPQTTEPKTLAQIHQALTLEYWKTHIHEIKKTQEPISQNSDDCNEKEAG